ncbi:MAG TPA: anthranilate phosphoribosyltransferase [Dongiaceae bacterium]|jgi:anthranilate phosphoribosyltransferase|nr:anthranilate phosphoribosyltransferase [Dongiaceae bacterium]
MSSLKPIIARLARGDTLSEQESEAAFTAMMEGGATQAQVGAILMALRLRGETIEEVTGAVRAMRAKMRVIDAPDNAIDVCGTGGDGMGSLNVSTAVAFICAACGVPVAKHGNKAASSKSGAADVLTALGVNIEADYPIMERALAEIGTAFLWAQRHHSAMRHVGTSRAELGTRTIFNVMGPLSNPAQVKRQLIGVFDRQWLEPLAKTLAQLGAERAWLVHGEDGLDEITVTGTSEIIELDHGRLRRFTVSPKDFGLSPAPLAAIKGDGPDHNADALRRLLAGEKSPYRDIVLMNAAAALAIAGHASSLEGGASLAAQAIDSGAARARLDALVKITNG